MRVKHHTSVDTAKRERSRQYNRQSIKNTQDIIYLD